MQFLAIWHNTDLSKSDYKLSCNVWFLVKLWTQRKKMLETLLTNGSVRGSWTKPSFATATGMWRASQSVKTHNQNHDNLLVNKLLINKTFRWFDHKHAHEILVVLKHYKDPIWLFGVLLHEQKPRFVEELFGSLLFGRYTDRSDRVFFLGPGGKRKPPHPLPTIIFQGRTRENYGVNTLQGVEGYEHEACNSTYLTKTPNPKHPTLITSCTRTASMIKINIYELCKYIRYIYIYKYIQYNVAKPSVSNVYKCIA